MPNFRTLGHGRKVNTRRSEQKIVGITFRLQHPWAAGYIRKITASSYNRELPQIIQVVISSTKRNSCKRAGILISKLYLTLSMHRFHQITNFYLNDRFTQVEHLKLQIFH